MSLLQSLSYKEYQKALHLSKEQCEHIAKLAKLNIHYQDGKKPGEQLMIFLDRRGYSVHHYNKFLSTLSTEKIVVPKCKVAVLIGNNDYKYLPKLATPIADCAKLSENLRSLGFIVVKIRNVTTSLMKQILDETFNVIPHESYCFIFYAGHGFESHDVKYTLGIDSPGEGISADYVLSEEDILSVVSKCQPEFCVLLMDMCRMFLEHVHTVECNQIIQKLNFSLVDNFCRESNQKLLQRTKVYIKNLIVAYSTQSAMSAYEEIQLECSKTIDYMQTYELRTCDLDKIVPGSSQYVDTLCRYIQENLDMGMLLDKVHSDLENAVKKQTPSKVQTGVAKSLHDPVKGEKKEIVKNLQGALSKFQEFCVI